jgi:hypothetical protein
MFSLWRKKFLPNKQRKPIRRAPRYVRPRLETLEDRLVLDAMTFAPAVHNGDGVNWFNANNWLDTTNPAIIAVPGANDSATIDGPFAVVIAGQVASVNSLSLGSGTSTPTLTINSSLDLTTMISAPGTTLTVAGGSQPAVLTVNESASFSGTVIDPGRIVANTTSPFDGTSVDFGGPTTIGPGDLNGNLVAGPILPSPLTGPATSPPEPPSDSAAATFTLTRPSPSWAISTIKP